MYGFVGKVGVYIFLVVLRMFFFLYVGIGERQVVMMFMRRRQIEGRAEVGLDVCGSGYGLNYGV